MKIINGMIFTDEFVFREGTVEIEDGKIANIRWGHTSKAEKNKDVIDASGKYVLPGLVDIHFHGCAGYDFCDATLESLNNIAAYEKKSGITTICPASMTYSEDILTKIVENAVKFRDAHADKDADLKKYSTIRGINLEGPFLSFAKRGAQNPKYLMKPDASMLRRLQKKADGLVKLVSIAPEIDGATECIKKCHNEFQFSIAHTEADYETASKAIEAGASHVTHLFNAMPPFVHRKPGVIGAAFDHEETDVEEICDGIHITPTVIRATFKLFGDTRVILISDSMMATGMKDGQYALGGQPVTVKGHLATLTKDGTIAGSATNLFDCMVNVIHMGISPESAVRAATYNPARSIGVLDQVGTITPGKAADCLIVDGDWKLKKVIHGGVI
ncbi:MAG: N-acetylglucosamine-6-phosphate deacetylase [Lachnospiraceae bacterium]|jgi:N-acetylglucosamine-6-phosphate deacetylase|nr:N-acetylglucosamine-6-phosphate deacetylase [Lachnospiraceae bacterium]